MIRLFCSRRAKKKYSALLLISGTLAGATGCSTITSYRPQAAAGKPTPPTYPIPIYTPDMEPPRPCTILGELSIKRTPITVFGGSIDVEMQEVMEKAHAKGADAIQIVEIQKPGFSSADYQVEAKLLRYADVWERVALTETDLMAYLRKNQAILDPIEGIWSDGLPNRIAILRDKSMPGRDFIAFTLSSDLANWLPGYKRMDIARSVAPDSYELKYYRDDFSSSDIIVTLDQNQRFQFILNSGDQSFPITFTKLAPPPKLR